MSSQVGSKPFLDNLIDSSATDNKQIKRRPSFSILKSPKKIANERPRSLGHASSGGQSGGNNSANAKI
jgi:hypothetical protein